MISFNELPGVKSCRLIDFSEAKVVPGFVNNTFILIVEGVKPCMNMEVRIIPVVYIEQPEYWDIEVVGCLNEGICLPAEKPYNVSFDLGHNIGTRGIEVVGADKTEKIPIGKFGHGSGS